MLGNLSLAGHKSRRRRDAIVLGNGFAAGPPQIWVAVLGTPWEAEQIRPTPNACSGQSGSRWAAFRPGYSHASKSGAPERICRSGTRHASADNAYRPDPDAGQTQAALPALTGIRAPARPKCRVTRQAVSAFHLHYSGCARGGWYSVLPRKIGGLARERQEHAHARPPPRGPRTRLRNPQCARSAMAGFSVNATI